MALATPPAKAVEYSFHTNSGGGFCDGIKFTPGSPALGYHVYDQQYCVFPNAYLGGFKGHVPALGPGEWYSFPVSSSANDESGDTLTLIFYINMKSLKWQLAYEDTELGVPFEFINGGILIRGKPEAHVGRMLRQTVVKAGLIKAGLAR